MGKTIIGWSDFSLNFWHGYTKVNDECEFCYMYRDKLRYGQNPYQIVQGGEKYILNILSKVKPGQMIFTCSWSDFFIESADNWRAWAWDIIKSHPQFIWQILTKRPHLIAQRLPKDWGEGYPGVILCVSGGRQNSLNIKLSLLNEIPAWAKMVSIEPILERVSVIEAIEYSASKSNGVYTAPDWVIVGGESGNDTGYFRYRPASLPWFDNLRTECRAIGVPLFVKQLGTHLAKELRLKDRHGANPDEFIAMRLDQQFPQIFKQYQMRVQNVRI